MKLSKTYRRTNKGRKIDWLPMKYYSRKEILESEEELIKLISETKVWPEERISSYKDWKTGLIVTKQYTVMINKCIVESYKTKLKTLQWRKNNPHREKDEGDYFAISYAKNPGHWNHWTYTKRKRAFDKKLIHKIINNKIDVDEAIFYHKKKPVIYYW